MSTMSREMNEPERRSTMTPVLVVVAIVALIGAAGVYMQERNAAYPNNGPAVVLAVAGGFLLLIAAVLSAGRRS